MGTSSLRQAEGAMNMLYTIVGAAAMLTAGTIAASAQEASADAIKELAPTGRLRAGINFGNSVLAQKDPAGKPVGVTPELSLELGKRLGLPVDLVAFEAAGKTFEAMTKGEIDLVYIAIEPVRAAQTEFTAPYVLIEGGYMVLKDSALKAVADVDKPGIRISVGVNSAYDLYLTRTIKNAQIVRASVGGSSAMIELFFKDKLEVVAGVKPVLVDYAKTDPRVRVMDGRFMVIEQAVGVPKGRTKAVQYLRAFIEDAKRSGFVADGLKRSGQTDATVAPPG
jgi:polar amino acid transport system substrate-binding protein